MFENRPQKIPNPHPYPLRVINIGIKPTAHQGWLHFHLKKILQSKKISKSSMLRIADNLISEI